MKSTVFMSRIEIPVLPTPHALFQNTVNRMKCRIMTGGKGGNVFPSKYGVKRVKKKNKLGNITL